MLEVPIEGRLADAGPGRPARPLRDQPLVEGCDGGVRGRYVWQQLRLSGGPSQQIVVPAENTGRRLRPVRVSVPHTVGLDQVMDGQIRVIRSDLVEVQPGLFDQHRYRPQASQERLLLRALDGQVGKRDPQHAVGVEARIARPGPESVQHEVLLIEARTHGQIVDLTGTVPSSDIHVLDAGLETPHLSPALRHGGIGVVGNRLDGLSGHIADDLARLRPARVLPFHEFVQQRDKVLVTAGAGGNGRWGVLARSELHGHPKKQAGGCGEEQPRRSAAGGPGCAFTRVFHARSVTETIGRPALYNPTSVPRLHGQSRIADT